MNVIESGPEDGVPVVLLHGNLSTGRFFEHLFDVAPARYRLLAPDMRGFGDTEPLPIDATRGLRDWADDTAALLDALGITAPPHLVGWSTGGAAIAAFAMERPVASLTFIDPVCAVRVRRDGARRHAALRGLRRLGRRAAATRTSPPASRPATPRPTATLAPRNVMNSSYWRVGHRESPEREDMLVGEILKSVTGDDGYPGDVGAVRALAGGRAGDARDPQRALAQVLQLGGDRRPVAEAADPVDARRAGHRRRRRLAVGAGDARLARRGAGLAGRGGVPAAADGGADPRGALGATRRAAGACETEWFEESGHFPPLDARERWNARLLRLPGVGLTSYAVPGLVMVDHELEVPLDHADPLGEQITIFAREVAEPEGRAKPFLVYLQGGPGFEAPRPTGSPRGPAWLDRALKDFRVLMLDQRGTGRSTPVHGGEPAEYLTHFRADSIVRDAELLRAALGLAALERARAELRRAVRVLRTSRSRRRACARRS